MDLGNAAYEVSSGVCPWRTVDLLTMPDQNAHLRASAFAAAIDVKRAKDESMTFFL
jgi:hypothetical protein